MSPNTGEIRECILRLFEVFYPAQNYLEHTSIIFTKWISIKIIILKLSHVLRHNWNVSKYLGRRYCLPYSSPISHIHQEILFLSDSLQLFDRNNMFFRYVNIYLLPTHITSLGQKTSSKFLQVRMFSFCSNTPKNIKNQKMQKNSYCGQTKHIQSKPITWYTCEKEKKRQHT